MTNVRLIWPFMVFVLIGTLGIDRVYGAKGRTGREIRNGIVDMKENKWSEKERIFQESGGKIREIDPNSEAEFDLVALRMRQTLVEVIGPTEAEKQATLDLNWLKDRARQHIDPKKYTGQIFLSVKNDGSITGHTIVRIEKDEEVDNGQPFGYFSTTFVDPTYRNQAIAHNLVLRGEKWMKEHGMKKAITLTAISNVKLQNLFKGLGYELTVKDERFVQLTKVLSD